MNTSLKMIGFAVALLAIFAVAFLAGNRLDPIWSPDSQEAEGDMGDKSEEAASDGLPGGLMVSQDGYTLDLQTPRSEARAEAPVRFRILGPGGSPVTKYDVEHEKRLHFIAVRRDLTGFQHVHPSLDAASGRWSTALDLQPGEWRVFADFKPTGADALTLGADLAVAGDFTPADPPEPSRTANVDGYEVTLRGKLEAGSDAKLTLRVSKDGRPVTDLQPYLGAYGHLVALRQGDLAYLHVHPDGEPGDGKTKPGPEAVFYAAVPSAGTYGLFLDFRHGGTVRTAPFTVSATQTEPALPKMDGGEHGGH